MVPPRNEKVNNAMSLKERLQVFSKVVNEIRYRKFLLESCLKEFSFSYQNDLSKTSQVIFKSVLYDGILQVYEIVSTNIPSHVEFPPQSMGDPHYPQNL